MPAVADMQNTIMKEFAGEPRVVTFILDASGQSRADIEEVWRNFYLRVPIVYDDTGAVNADYYQPSIGLPFSRTWIIGTDQHVVLPYFGYNPDLVIDTIYSLLADMGPPGDFDGDCDVDLADLGVLLANYNMPAGATYPDGDVDGDGDIDLVDLGLLLANYNSACD